MPQITDRFKGASTARQKHLQAGRTAPAPKKSTGTRPNSRPIRAEAKKRDANRAAAKKVTDGKSKEDRATLNANEGQAATEFSNSDNPNDVAIYKQFLQIQNLTGKDRDDAMDFLREVAAEEFEPYFEEERQALITDVQFVLNSLQQKYGKLDDVKHREFTQAIEKLDHDSAKELDATFTAATQRGLMGTGVMKILAQRVIDDEKFSAKQLQEDLDDDLRFASEEQALAEREIEINQDREERRQRNQNKTDVEADARKRAEEAEAYALANKERVGGATIDDITGDFVGKGSAVPDQSLSIEEQRAQREAAMIPERAAARDIPPPPPPRRRTSTIGRVVDDRSKAIQSKRTVEGSAARAIQDRTELRRQKRIAEAKARANS